ncbi:expressed unknown protein [Seminavis robusta]|uniref:Uncharacterized protein n=1 Tax=Seminavis robusta TaxID=568900 RepID=A0A9N8HCQ1_9STRA|nr:expressed unknown protein [Seminavis robusta]|eukprot:Sro391_g133070.1 n/a (391) ;mRNA; r:20966-22138
MESASSTVVNDPQQAVKSSSNTAPTCVQSSEEFSISAELTNASVEDGPALQLSNMAIVDERKAVEEPSMSFDDDPTPSSKVRFAAEITVIKEEDIAVERPKKKKNKKNKRRASTGGVGGFAGASDDDSDYEPTADDIWWSQQDLESVELNAMYMVKESQQYQEEVICTVLYNKAFLSATNLAKSITEEEVDERMKDVHDHSNTLEKWTDVGNSRRGLENMISEKVVENAVASRCAVLLLQRELREAASLTAESLAKCSQDATRNARIMARMMGQADADALAKANAQAAESIRLPEPPGRYSGDHERTSEDGEQPVSGRAARRSKRGSIIAPLKKAVGNVFRRQGSREVNMRRIRKIQEKRMKEEQEQEQPKRPSEEFRRSFLDSLDYGEQ